jgi:hypothetical protein
MSLDEESPENPDDPVAGPSTHNSETLEQRKLEFEREKFNFERKKYAAETARREADLEKVLAELREVPLARRRSNLQIVLTALTPLALIVGAFITLQKDVLIRSNQSIQHEKTTLEAQKKDLEVQKANLEAGKRALEQVNGSLENRKAELENGSDAARQKLEDLNHQFAATKTEAERSAKVARIDAYMDALLTEEAPTLDSPTVHSIAQEARQGQGDTRWARLENRALSARVPPPYRVLLCLVADQISGDHRWLERAIQVLLTEPLATSGVARKVLLDSSTFTTLDRERYLRALYAQTRTKDLVQDLSSLWEQLYKADVARDFRDPYIDSLLIVRERMLKNRPDSRVRGPVRNGLLVLQFVMVLCCADLNWEGVGTNVFGKPGWDSSELVILHDPMRRHSDDEHRRLQRLWREKPENQGLVAFWVNDENLVTLRNSSNDLFGSIFDDAWDSVAKLRSIEPR